MVLRTSSLLICVALVACGEGGLVLRKPERELTPWERYAQSLAAAGLDSTALGRDWLLASDSALRASLPVSVPFREAGFYSRSEARAVAFSFTLTEGQRLDVEVRHEGPLARMFVDLFRQSGDSIPAFEHRATAARPDSGSSAALVVAYEVREAGTYFLRLQPELLRDGRYELDVRAGPMLAFPVQGVGNRAVQSLFGADRDGGSRRHHGIDIFAPRGTPVLAATSGVVRSIRPNSLGGNVVWLTDTRRGQTLYYAHLDSHAVRGGDVVEAGDTLGFVGNTGNARSTRPHLHFGLYRRGFGPVDPWPYVRLVTATAPRITADTSRIGTVVATGRRMVTVRRAPQARADTVRSVPGDTPLHIVGAQAGWYRVQLATGEAGYVAGAAVGRRLAVRHPSALLTGNLADVSPDAPQREPQP